MRSRFGKARMLHIILVTLVYSALATSCSEDGSNKQETSSLTKSNLNQLFQTAIDLPKLQEFFHLEMESRKVLCITGEFLPDNLELNKNGQPIKIVSSLTECENCILFDIVKITNNKAQLVMVYEIEGVVCELELQLQNGAWQVGTSTLTEH